MRRYRKYWWMAVCLAAVVFSQLACTSQPAVKPPKPAGIFISQVQPVTPDFFGVVITTGQVEYGSLQPYRTEKDDKFLTNDPDNTWLVRNGQVKGALLGTKEGYVMGFDQLSGETLNLTQADDRTQYLISSPDDPDYNQPLGPVAVFRKTRPTDLLRTSKERLTAPLEHTLYLKLPRPLKTGHRYVLAFRNKQLPDVAFRYDPRTMRSEAVHMSHIGFRPDDPVKVAFLSLWAGSGGPVDFREGTAFYVLDQASGAEVFRGTVKLSKAAKDRDEDAYYKNYNGVNVYWMDFSNVNQEGLYRIYVEGTGCSYPFEIRKGVWEKAFSISARGLYHQRSGIALGPPYTDFRRPRNLHPDDGVKVYASRTTLMETPNGFLGGEDNFSKLIAGRTSELVPQAWGGYCDAGDWDRRIQHLEAARRLLDLAEIFPDFFSRVNLNIPESKDALPDIVNEALWGVDFFRRLQTPEGGVRGGIESSGHPHFGETSWRTSQSVMAYAPDLWSTYLYAGAAARVAYWFRRSDPKKAQEYEKSALSAMEWAEKDLKSDRKRILPHQVHDARNLAAAELFRLTGEGKWHELFLSTTVFNKRGEPLSRHEKHDQGEAAWVYCRTKAPNTDKQLQQRCREAILQAASQRISAQEKTGFKWSKDPWRPARAGAFTTPDALYLIHAHILTGKESVLKAILLAAQMGAGANPLNICYTTGVGHKSPRHALHVDSRFTGQLPPPGLTVLGPVDVEWSRADAPDHQVAGRFCYPTVKTWPVMESYWDVFWYPLMSEFTVHQTIVPNAFVWGYLAARGYH
ncbi:MAG: glycoside hydrolase family 9 protein [Deltaproteobacteria bacterium]|nr:glycoside hydrolase family 9 protein [Deltaproteobacteria bacterium]